MERISTKLTGEIMERKIYSSGTFKKNDYVFPDWAEFQLPNAPLLRTFLNQTALNKLWEYIDTAKEKSKIKKDKMRETLAGNISSSLTLEDKDDWFFTNVLEKTVGSYVNNFSHLLSFRPPVRNARLPRGKSLFRLETLWANFQKQHEFNPVHDHSGAVSFVIWLKIPTDWREQHELPFVKNTTAPVASDFQFAYCDMLGNITTMDIFLDPSLEGSMMMFPAALKHQVYPFYNCEEERISISGNVWYDFDLQKYEIHQEGSNPVFQVEEEKKSPKPPGGGGLVIKPIKV